MKGYLNHAKMWETTVVRLLKLPYRIPILSYLVEAIPKYTLPPALQLSLSNSLLEVFDECAWSFGRPFITSLSKLANSESFAELHADLKMTIAIWLCRYELEADLPEVITELRNAIAQDDFMTDSHKLERFRRSLIDQETTPLQNNRTKRRRLPIRSKEDGANELSRVVSRILTGSEHDDLARMTGLSISAYLALSDDDKCICWRHLASLSRLRPSSANPIILTLLDSPDLSSSKQPRVLSMLAIAALVQTTEDMTLLDLKVGTLGRACTAALHSSLRELRIAAAHTLPSFLRDGLPDELRTRNRQLAMEYLRSLSDRDVASEQETLIMAWGQAAISCGETELNLVLLRLVDYLGHRNFLVCAFAATEIEKIAQAKGKTTLELFQPFWRSIAVSVVQDLVSKPQKAQQLVDLLEMNLNSFLLMTQRDTLPALVLTKNRDVLQRIAAARKRGTGIQDLCLEPRTNLVAILTLLLSQPVSDPEETAFRCLCEAAPAFKGTDIAELVRLDPVLMTCEMLKHCGEEDEQRKKQAHQVFQLFANIAERVPGQRKSSAKSAHAMTSLFERLMLGILFQFSTILESPGQSTLEKKSSLSGIGEMAVLSKGQVSLALPQIRACLQYGLAQDELREVAFGSWLTLLSVLEADDIVRIVEETFALVVRHWSALTSETHRKIHDALGVLVKTHNEVLQDNIMLLPSLEGIPLLSKFASEFNRLKKSESVENQFKAYSRRLKVDSDTVALQAIREVVPFLEEQQRFIHDNAASENPAPALFEFLRSLLDTTVRFASDNAEAAELCGKALGTVGCLDPNRIETTRKRRQIMVLSNFDRAAEVISWVKALLEDVLVAAFKTVTNSRSQGFLAFVIQELLKFCNFTGIEVLRTRASQEPAANQMWMEMPEHIRITLTPLLTSKYSIISTNGLPAPNRTYPSFSPETTHSQWLTALTYDLMFRATGDNPKMLFPLLARVVRVNDSIATFVLPYAVLNVVLGGIVTEVEGILKEFLAVLEATPAQPEHWEATRLCSDSVFAILDYMSSWLREKRLALNDMRVSAYKTGASLSELGETQAMAQVEAVEKFIGSIPAVTIAIRAINCRSDARALFHWEQHIRQKRPLVPSGQLSAEAESTYERLLEIYAQIDEPDGLEGISAHLSVLSEEQRAINHSKAGRWTAAQAWYEMQLADEPANIDLQTDVLRCLRETGQSGALLKYADDFLRADPEPFHVHLSMAAEACFMTENMPTLQKYLMNVPAELDRDFNIATGKILLNAAEKPHDDILAQIRAMQRAITARLSVGATDSLQKCHDELRQLHVLYEIEDLLKPDSVQTPELVQNLNRRLAAVGSYTQNKQYILGVRRAVMSLRSDVFANQQVGSLWHTTARLARQANNTKSAYDAVLKAYDRGDKGAKLEEARLLWHDGHQRQAISLLDAAINSRILDDLDENSAMRTTNDSSEMVNGQKQNLTLAKALLLLAKWLDASGQSQTRDMTERYQSAAKRFQRWEKGHYYLGKHYSKLLDAQKALPKDKRSQSFESGEMAKLVIDNTLRSIPFGNKYWHETIPKVLTLWLELGMDTLQKAPREDQATFEKRVKSLTACNRQLQKYFDRVAPYVFYPSLSQLISRITHPHPEVWKQLSNIIFRIASSHPSQALWSLFGVVRARDPMRSNRGVEILTRLKDPKNRASKNDSGMVNLSGIITQGQKLCDGLLQACEAPVEPRATHVRLGRDLNFNHKLAPCQLVVPIEATLTASAPSMADVDTIRRHKAFTQEKITIQGFTDDVLVLSSLQRPKKITARGSDGKKYGLLCKPKDDLRKDQRLMEFNGIINRALKRDNESSKRRLYIKTYAVTPLSEESGTIEWVEGIKPIRDILLSIYGRKGIRPDYTAIRKDLEEACKSTANVHLFASRVLSVFPPAMHEWFAETYPAPDAWFAARLRYARSAAVMSMTGHMLGLGDRHGENILLEESTGGVFHVDFNCLFDKGLTFEKPELVPFRLTHNMQDAMGPYGHEGPFRKSSELTMALLRQERDTLMTILETFLYDPTTDFVGNKKKRSTAGVPETPAEILESVATKLKGLLRGETVPLSVEGYVDALIQQATSHANLAGMYIGWCSFL